jgi:hypothetical protein
MFSFERVHTPPPDGAEDPLRAPTAGGIDEEELAAMMRKWGYIRDTQE